MHLTRQEKEMATGKYGAGVEKCMDILVKFGETFGAERLIEIASAHTMPNEPVELLKEMTDGAEQIQAFTTLHSMMSGFSPHQWRKMGIPETFALAEASDFEQRQKIYRRLGFYQTYTCLPMLVGNLPRKGDCVSWIGSGAQLMVNSLIGARNNRDGTLINLASAITGRSPLLGLFLDENRYADIVVELKGLDPLQLSATDLGAVGYYVGGKAQDKNIVINGLPKSLRIDQLKYLMAPLSTSGAVSICHIVGVTPEALTLEQALGRRKASDVLHVGYKEIEATKALYGGNGPIDMVVLGCPHCTVPELREIAALLERKRIGSHQRLWVGIPYQMYYLAEKMGYVQIVEKAGGVIASSCMATVPDAPIPDGVKKIATNSFKAAHYITRLTKGKVSVSIQDMPSCIQAITGKTI